MNKSTMNARAIALNETDKTGNNETNATNAKEGNLNRRFSLADIWRIRRSARVFKIHDRIPKL